MRPPVQRVGSVDDHGVESGAFQHGVPVPVAVPGVHRGSGESFLVAVADGHEHTAGVLGHGVRMELPDPTPADDAHSYGHDQVLSSTGAGPDATPSWRSVAAMPWLEFDSLVNARDLGGTPCTDGGEIASGRLLRSDNLQDLTDADVARLLELGLTDVVDLRSTIEVEHEGPGPLSGVPAVTVHHLSYLPETDLRPLPDDDPADVSTEALPWVGKEPSVGHDDVFASHYLSYLQDRPENVVAALRTIAHAEGAALVHCAAGKDRTGTTVAFALTLAGADRAAVVADYARSSERMQLIIDRLMGSELYRADLAGRPLSSHLTNPETMQGVLDHLDTHYGGVEGALQRVGWTADDTAALRARLRG